MGWKGTVRSINAAAKRADRNAKKRQREIEKSKSSMRKCKNWSKLRMKSTFLKII